jgi:hypothetical protein
MAFCYSCLPNAQNFGIGLVVPLLATSFWLWEDVSSVSLLPTSPSCLRTLSVLPALQLLCGQFLTLTFPLNSPLHTSINSCGQLSWTHPLQASSPFLSLTFLGPLHLQCLHSPSAHLLFQSRHHLTFLWASAALGGRWSSPCFHEYTGFSSSSDFPRLHCLLLCPSLAHWGVSGRFATVPSTSHLCAHTLCLATFRTLPHWWDALYSFCIGQIDQSYLRRRQTPLSNLNTTGLVEKL